MTEIYIVDLHAPAHRLLVSLDLLRRHETINSIAYATCTHLRRPSVVTRLVSMEASVSAPFYGHSELSLQGSEESRNSRLGH